VKSICRCWSILGPIALLWVLAACTGPMVMEEDQRGAASTPLPAQHAQRDAPDLEPEIDLSTTLTRLEHYDSRRSFQTTRIYDRRGNLLDEVYGEGQRTWVPLDAIPEALKQATIATEDATFYSNPGIDPLAMGRAFLQNAQAGEIVSGGSTITQQLVRLIVFPYEQRVRQTVSRKVAESILATRLTQMWSKDKILETYLNEIYYGHRAYGAAAAAETYFDKPVSDLTLAESALLAGLPQAPSRLDPHENLDRAKQRQRQVLRLMVEAGYITQDEANAAYDEELTLKLPQRIRQAPHFADYVLQVLEEAYGRDTLRQGGLQVTTTLDLRYQRLAEEIARRQVEALRDRHNLTNASVVIMQPQTGQILAMVGSVDYNDASIDGQVNVALRPRQPGSAIKPITYAAAFEQGFTPATIVWDIPTAFPLEGDETYQPTNYDDRFHGPLRLREALANSYNVPAVKVLNKIGLETMIDKAHAMGITGLKRDPYRYYGLSLTLGGGEVSLLDLTTAYATLANGGGYIPPAPVLKVVDGTGETIYEYRRPEPGPAVDPAAAFLVTDILADNRARQPAFGQHNPLELDRPAAVKTGTTTDFRDNWTIGYTPYLVVGVWTGNSDNTPMQDVSGVEGAAPLWRELMESVFRIPSLHDVLQIDDQPLSDTFRRPAGIEEAEICDLVDLRAGRGCQHKHKEFFAEGTVPEEKGTVYDEATVVRIPRPILASDDTPGALFCQATEQWGVPAGGVVQTMEALYPPRDDEEEAARVRAWAATHGVPLVTSEPCTPELLAGLPGGALGAAAVNATWHIASPTPGQLITRTVSITGTALFSPNDIAFYKVEFARSTAPTRWITMGETHTTPVQDGQLEVWHADGLEPGSYTLRLVLVKPDGNWLPPYTVPVRIGR